MGAPPSKRRKTASESFRHQLDAFVTPRRVERLSEDERRDILEMLTSRLQCSHSTSDLSLASVDPPPKPRTGLPYHGISREIRDMIYGHLLYVPDGVRVEQSTRPPFGIRTPSPLPLATLRANKQMRVEVLECFYSINRLILDVRAACALNYLQTLERCSLDSIRYLELGTQISGSTSRYERDDLTDFIARKTALRTITLTCDRDEHWEYCLAHRENNLHQYFHDSRGDRPHYLDSRLAKHLCDLLVCGEHFTELRLVYSRYYGQVDPLELTSVRELYFKDAVLEAIQKSAETGEASYTWPDMEWPTQLKNEIKRRDFEASVEGDADRGTVIVLRRLSSINSGSPTAIISKYCSKHGHRATLSGVRQHLH